MQNLPRSGHAPRTSPKHLPAAAEAHGRDLTVDTLKGLGIVLVVVGHIYKPSTEVIFWFHMPLFFLISGFLYRRPATLGSYFEQKRHRLLIPYASFLALLSAPVMVVWWRFLWANPRSTYIGWLYAELGKLMWGGRALQGDYGTAWFVTCLVIAQVLYCFLERCLSGYKLLASVLALYAFGLYHAQHWGLFPFPLNADVAPVAVLFLYVGHQLAAQRLLESRALLLLSAIAALLAFAVDSQYPGLLYVDMKQAKYGAPGLSPLIAVAFSVVAFAGAARLTRLLPVARGFAELGRASFVIMFVHPFVRDYLLKFESTRSDLLRIVAGLILPLALYHVFRQTSLTRRLFLGERAR